MHAVSKSNRRTLIWTIFRIALFASAVSLAAFVPYKYATQLHAITGIYAFLFPWAGVLAIAGIVLALRPRSACDCSVPMRAGIGSVAALWMVTGVICVPSLAEGVINSPLGGMFATFHMLVQHVFLSLSVLAFAFAPRAMARMMGVPVPIRVASDASESGKLLPSN